MQALRLTPSAGWQWVGAGWRLFRRQPFSFAALLFFYWVLLLSASAVVGWLAQGIGALLPFVPVDLVAALGGLAVAALTPALTVGFLQACRVADQQQQVHPVLLFAPFRAGRTTLLRLLALGAFQVIVLVVILFATSGTAAFRDDPGADAAPAGARADAPLRTEAGTPSGTPSAVPADARPTAAEEAAMRREAVHRLMQGAAYVPVALLMWYAPMLVAWHRLPAGKALFFSLVAVWRNRGAFAIYGIAWLVIWFGLSIAIAAVASLLGVGNFTAMLAAPLVMLLLSCMYCSVYPTYATVFVETGQAREDPTRAA